MTVVHHNTVANKKTLCTHGRCVAVFAENDA